MNLMPVTMTTKILVVIVVRFFVLNVTFMLNLRNVRCRGYRGFWGEDRPPQGVESSTQASKKASIRLFRASIGKVVFRGFWPNLPGILAELFHFSGDSG